MIYRIISDINRSLENECYLAALSLALILPDMCGKVESPDKGNKSRYINWCDKFLSEQYYTLHHPIKKTILDGAAIYYLRCCFLHEGNPTIEGKKGIAGFCLVTEKKKGTGKYKSNIIQIKIEEDLIVEGDYLSVNVGDLCSNICEAAKNYYEENKSHFKFHYNIIDYDSFIANKNQKTTREAIQP